MAVPTLRCKMRLVRQSALLLVTLTACQGSVAVPTAGLGSFGTAAARGTFGVARAESTTGAGAYPKHGDLLLVTQYPAKIGVYSGLRNLSLQRVATISLGLDRPQQVAVDDAGTLYVANEAGFVSVFPNGSVVPSRIVTAGLHHPIGAVVDANGTLYVSNSNPPSIVEFPKGSSQPLVTIMSPAFEFLQGEALDAAGNLYVVSGGRQIFEIPAGSRAPHSLGLENLDKCGIGDEYDYIFSIKFDKHGTLFVSCPNGNTFVLFKLPIQYPFAKIAGDAIYDPFFFDFDRAGDIVVTNSFLASAEVLNAAYQTAASIDDLYDPFGAFVRLNPSH
jgi:hypothetical protein